MGKKSELQVNGQTLEVSNLDKIFYPATGFTKGEMIDYYIRIADVMLPHLRNRPLTLKRFPNGIHGPHFYEKNAPDHAPKWIKTAQMARKNGGSDINFVLINDVASLVWAANLASIEMHILLSRAPRLDRPDFVVFDLDPGEPANVIQCAQVALWLRDLLQELKLTSFIKSSGSKGLQLYIPLNTPCAFEQTKEFSEAVAQRVESEHSDLVVTKMATALRRGKVFIDWSQNSRHKTTVCAYSLRAKREHPYVAMPLEWGAVVKALEREDPAAFDFSPETALQAVKDQNDLFAPLLTMKQKIPTAYADVLKSRSEKKVPRLRGTGDRTLKAYEAKRNFTETKEPSAAKRPKTPGTKQPLFVIQKHRASHLHYDFRLEMEGALKSWAVPKGVPYTKGEKRLAMHVEDHPLDYARFEGTIPAGNYGAGTVMVWDIGTYELTDGNIHQGKLHFVLKGKKLKGEWILIRGRGDSQKEHWFLIKADSDFPRLSARKDDSSALTGRSLDEIAAQNDAQWVSNRD